LVLFSQKSHAVTIEAQSDRTSLQQTFVVLADPVSESTAVQLRLNVEGGVVTSFSAGDDGLLSIGTCDEEGSKYTESAICVDIANSIGVFEQADVLGVFVVDRFDTYTQLKISKAENNAYTGTNGLLETDSGTAFVLFGSNIVQSKSTKTTSNGYIYLFLMVTFLMGVVIGTTFTTLGHVLQAGKLHQKKSKKD